MRRAKNFDFAKVQVVGQIPRGPHNWQKSKTLRESAEIASRKNKGRAAWKTRTRGPSLLENDSRYVMVTFTVMAGLVTPPDDGVTVSVVVLGFGPFPLQPATMINTSIAPAIPMRVRKRRVAGIMNSRAIASITRSSCCLAVGGTFMDSGATMKEAAVRVPLTMAPGAAAALVVGTAHAVTSVLPGVHVKETMPVNPPSPVMVTGKVPIAPLATLALPAVTEKSQAVPVSPTVWGLPLALSVTETASVTVPGAVDD